MLLSKTGWSSQTAVINIGYAQPVNNKMLGGTCQLRPRCSGRARNGKTNFREIFVLNPFYVRRSTLCLALRLSTSITRYLIAVMLYRGEGGAICNSDSRYFTVVTTYRRAVTAYRDRVRFNRTRVTRYRTLGAVCQSPQSNVRSSVSCFRFPNTGAKRNDKRKQFRVVWAHNSSFSFVSIPRFRFLAAAPSTSQALKS